MLSLRRHRRSLAGTAAVSALASVLGCSRPPAPVEVDEPPPEPAAEVHAVEPVEPAEPVGAAPTPPREETEPPPEPASTDEPEPDPVAGNVGAPVGEGQEIVVDLDEERRASLAAEAEQDLQQAVQAVRAAQTRPLSPEELETLATVEGLVAAARDALAADDIQAAATLANKAKLLAAELATD